VPAAVAVELVHNASLLHDDLLDGDQMRRGRPAVWSAFGTSAALLAGDALFFLAVRVMADPCATIALAGPGGGLGGSTATGPGVVCLADAVRELVEGEYADIVLEQRAQVSVEESQAMAARKTAALLAASCALGAMAAGVAGPVVQRFRDFGHHVGVAFQYVDDLLGIWGDPAVTGKPARSDLATRKKSLPVAYALASGTPAGADLAGLYATPGPLADGHLEQAAELVEQAGGRAWATAQADQHITAALDHLAAMRTLTGRQGEAVADLVALANLITHRDC
jgi:geranylgeranyl diphosphate synthase type I